MFLWLFSILWNVLVKKGPWYHWYPGATRYTPNARPHQMNIMTHKSVPKVGFASQTRVNGSPFISRASSVEEKNQAYEVWSSVVGAATPQQEKHMVGRFLFPLVNIIKSFGSTIKLCLFLLHRVFRFL